MRGGGGEDVMLLDANVCYLFATEKFPLFATRAFVRPVEEGRMGQGLGLPVHPDVTCLISPYLAWCLHCVHVGLSGVEWS